MPSHGDRCGRAAWRSLAPNDEQGDSMVLQRIYGVSVLLTVGVLVVLVGLWRAGAPRHVVAGGMPPTTPVAASTSPARAPADLQPGPSATAAWTTYVNSIYGWAIDYPPDWTVLAPVPGVSETTGVTEIRRDLNVYTLHNLLFQSRLDDPNPEQSAELGIRLLLNLPGWPAPAVAEQTTIGGEPARKVSAQIGGGSTTHLWVWHDHALIEVTWGDTADRAEQQTFDLMLSTFRFLPE